MLHCNAGLQGEEVLRKAVWHAPRAQPRPAIAPPGLGVEEEHEQLVRRVRVQLLLLGRLVLERHRAQHVGLQEAQRARLACLPHARRRALCAPPPPTPRVKLLLRLPPKLDLSAPTEACEATLTE